MRCMCWWNLSNFCLHVLVCFGRFALQCLKDSEFEFVKCTLPSWPEHNKQTIKTKAKQIAIATNMISKWNVSNIKYWDICQSMYTHPLTACAYFVIESVNRQELCIYISYAQSHLFISLLWSFFFHPFIPSSHCTLCAVLFHAIALIIFNVYHHGRQRINACFQ